MGVINTTPDSFSDGGTLYRDSTLDLDRALARVATQVDEGALVIDIGGESTRPGAPPVTIQQEMDRVLPLVEQVAARFPVVISIDSSTPELMTEAAGLGAGMLNDVRALTRPGALEAAAATGLPVCLMHMQGEPGNMQTRPHYQNVVSDVVGFLLDRVARCEQAGIDREHLLIDPGFGFGKTVTHNLQLLDHLPRLGELGLPVLVGLSRKSMIGKILGRDVDQRLPASLALAVIAAQRGASIIRTHDVQATGDALAMYVAMLESGEQ